MAKKKVYRRKPAYTPKKPVKKPPMPRNTKIALLAGAGVLVLAIILFSIFYSDGSLKYNRVLEGEGATATTKNVVVVPEGENWLIINKGTTSRPKYYKLGSLQIPDGYVLDEEFGAGSDANVKQYHCVPAEESSPIQYVHVQGVNKKPADIAAEALKSYGSFYAESENSEILETELHGMTATYFTSKFGAEDENGAIEYHQSLTLYLPAVRESSVLINVMVPIADMQGGLTQADLLAYAEQMAGNFTPENE